VEFFALINAYNRKNSLNCFK